MGIYLVYSNPSDWESCPGLIGYTQTEEDAKSFIVSLKESYLKAEEFFHKTFEYDRKFELENPSPIMADKLIEVPRWESGLSKKDITEDMRKERIAIQEKNELIAAENSRNYNAWKRKKMDFIKPLIKAVDNTPWFKQWFTLYDTHLSCNANGLVEGYEYTYEYCEELK